jgi:hypothetical protein
MVCNGPEMMTGVMPIICTENWLICHIDTAVSIGHQYFHSAGSRPPVAEADYAAALEQNFGAAASKNRLYHPCR